jgi:hypothetical protein
MLDMRGCTGFISARLVFTGGLYERDNELSFSIQAGNLFIT